MMFWLLKIWVILGIKFGVMIDWVLIFILLVLVNNRFLIFMIVCMLYMIVIGIKICWEMVLIIFSNFWLLLVYLGFVMKIRLFVLFFWYLKVSLIGLLMFNSCLLFSRCFLIWLLIMFKYGKICFVSICFIFFIYVIYFVIIFLRKLFNKFKFIGLFFLVWNCILIMLFWWMIVGMMILYLVVVIMFWGVVWM